MIKSIEKFLGVLISLVFIGAIIFVVPTRIFSQSNFETYTRVLVALPEGGFVGVGDATEHRSDQTRRDNYWVFRLSSDGKMLWDKIIGSSTMSGFDGTPLEIAQPAKFIATTNDGGFLIPGQTSGVASRYSHEGWLIRLASSSALLWHKPYGEPKAGEILYCARQTADGGFIAGGSFHSFERNKKGLWIIKLDAMGEITWEKIFPEYMYATDVQELSHGGYVVLGQCESASTRTDVVLLRIDSNGEKIWEKVIGGPGYQWVGSLLQTDGGFVISATLPYTPSMVLLAKFNENGQQVWLKQFAKPKPLKGIDYIPLIHPAPGGSFFVLTATTLEEMWNKSWVLMVNSAGIKQWEKVCGPGARATIAEGNKLAIVSDIGSRQVKLTLYSLGKNMECDIP